MRQALELLGGVGLIAISMVVWACSVAVPVALVVIIVRWILG